MNRVKSKSISNGDLHITPEGRFVRANNILKDLKKHYPNLVCPLKFSNPYELLIATILAAQCTDARVNMVTPFLFARYPSPEKLAESNIDDVKKIIKSTGFFNHKAKNIILTARKIVKDFTGEVPQSMEELITLPGVARKTANVVLGIAFHKNEGIPVDTHVKRLSWTLGLSENSNPVQIEKDLMKLFPKSEWTYISLAFVYYGREFCTARKHDQSLCFLGHFR